MMHDPLGWYAARGDACFVPWSMTTRARLLWSGARVTALVGLLALVIGVLLQAGVTLPLFWNVVLPLVPAALLVSPGLWRGVCPVATISMWTSRPEAPRIAEAPSRSIDVVAVVLLFAIVPARHLLWNQNGAAFFGLLVVVALLALGAGRLGPVKAGFCNAICPVLPVERLYGQAPLFHTPNARCALCALCTVRGCVDLAPTKAVAQVLGPARVNARWLGTGFGFFAAAFPGFILAYGLTPDGPLSAAATVYGVMLVAVLASWAVVAAVCVVGNVPARLMIPGLAAASLGLYYWFAAPGFMTTIGFSDWGVVLLRVGVGVLLLFWVARLGRGVRSGAGTASSAP